MSIRFASKKFVGTFSGIFLPGIKVELVGSEILLAGVGAIFSVVSFYFIFEFEITQVF